MYHKISFAPAGSLIEYTYKGVYKGGVRGRRLGVRILSGISPTGRSKGDVCRLANMLDYYAIRKIDPSRKKKPFVLPKDAGKIRSFSRRSRSRLNKKIASIRKNQIPCFVTLTYHNQYPTEFEDFKYHLHKFFVNLHHKFPNFGAIWKLEFQKRGAPHYHLLIWGVSVKDLQEYVPAIWNKIAGYESIEHLAWHKGELGHGNKHCVQEINSWHGVTSYAAKYFSKVDETLRSGRIWGVRGHVPFSKILEFSVNFEIALKFRRYLANLRHYEFSRLGFWTADYEVFWLLVLDDMIRAYELENIPPEDPPDWELQIQAEDFYQDEIYIPE